MAFKLKLTVSGVPSGGYFRKYKKLFDREIKIASSDIKKRLIRLAKESHKYKHQSRQLRDDTKVIGDLINGDIELFVDVKNNKYAGFIVTGSRNDPRYGTVKVKTGPDPFIEGALDKSADYIVKRVQRAINKSIIEFNRLK